jgi:hypothetical protein
VENARVREPVSPCSQEDIERLGFEFWLKDVLTGPEKVIETLCHLSQIHAIVFTLPTKLIKPITRRSLSPEQHKAVMEFTRDTPNGKRNIISQFIAGKTQSSIVRSRYGNKEVSESTTSVNAHASWFSDTGDSSSHFSNESRFGKESTT